MLREFCTNSRRWITLMCWGRPPLSCPYRQENFCHCDNCGYKEDREETPYIKRVMKILGEWDD